MFEGIRVIEVASWTFVPAAAMLLADFGAEVVKVEPPGGDPQRGLVGPAGAGAMPSVGGVSLTTHQSNRGKRSITLDLTSPAGREVLHRLVESADVFMTNYLPDARAALHIDVGDLRERNPGLIYVRGDALGHRGPEAGRPGFDHSVFWARGGIGAAITGPGAERMARPRPAMGDKTASLSMAFGVASALFRRAATGEGSLVDVSLLGTAVWVNSSDVVYSAHLGHDVSADPRVDPHHRTADDRWVLLDIPNPHRWLPDVAGLLDREDLLHDERFATREALDEHRAAFRAEIDGAVAGASLREWTERLHRAGVPGEPVQTPHEVLDDPQVVENGYVGTADHPNGEAVAMVRPPVQFDGDLPLLRTAPAAGADTEAVLREAGYSTADIDRLGGQGALG